MTTVGSILTDLDSMFDTRLPIAFALDKHETAKAISNTKYFNRKYNDIGKIPSFVFETYYRRRSYNILDSAIPTFVPGLILDNFIELRSEPDADNMLDSIKIYLNTYPYEITFVDQANLIKNMANNFGTPNIEVIHKSPKELDPEYIYNNNIVSMYMYSGLEWLDVQTSNPKISYNPLTNRALIVPTILNKSVKEKLDADFFMKLREQFTPLIDLYPIETKYFCANFKVDLKRKENDHGEEHHEPTRQDSES